MTDTQAPDVVVTEAGSETCRRCGHDNRPWSAPSPLWNAVMRGGSIDGEPIYDDMVCAACFIQLATEDGIALGWRVTAENVLVPLETVTPSGRVWDADQFLWADTDSLSGQGRLMAIIEPLLRFHESGGHEGDGSDERLAMIRAALSSAIGEPYEFSGWVEVVEDDRG